MADDDVTLSTTAVKYLTFSVADERYGVPVTRVEEVLEYQPITVVPRCPSFLLGVINVRGRLIPVMDLRRRLGLEDAEITVETRIVVMTMQFGEEDLSVGAVTDRVEGVIDIEDECIEPPPRIGASGEDVGLSGTARTEDAIFLLLDVNRLVTPEYLDAEFDALAAARR
ncbi:MAG: chemotaxis protein CheW [Spirochaetaceae bacterium]